MNRALRNKHLSIWMVLALLLPLAFIWAYAVIPQSLSKTKSSEAASGNLFLAEHITDPADADKLRITIQQPLTTPSTLVYIADRSNPDIEKAILVGSLGPKGTYQLPLPSTLPGDPVILFYDAINKNLYHQIDFP